MVQYVDEWLVIGDEFVVVGQCFVYCVYLYIDLVGCDVVMFVDVFVGCVEYVE